MNSTDRPDHIDTSRAALIVYDACRRALTSRGGLRRHGHQARRRERGRKRP